MNTDRMQLQGGTRQQALDRFHEQLRAWDIAAPDVVPLVLDFGLNDFWSTGLIECWLANEMKAGYCGKYLFVSDAQSCPAHRHRVKHETFFLVKGSLRVVCDDVERTMVAGDLLPIAPPQVHSFTGQGSALLLELSMPCDVADNDFANPAINRWLRDALEPAMQAGSSSRSPSNEAL